MARTLRVNHDWIRALHQSLLSLNLAVALWYGLAAYSLLEVTLSKSFSNGYAFLYFFFRGAIRINNLLHLRHSNAPYGGWPNVGSQVGVDLMLTLSVIALAAIVLTCIRLLSRIPSLGIVVNAVGGFLVLWAIPGAYLSVRSGSWAMPNNSLWTVAALEFCGSVLLFFVYRWHPLPTWAIGAFLGMHYYFWVRLLWDDTAGLPPDEMFSARIFLSLFVISGGVWLLQLQDSGPPAPSARRTGSVGMAVSSGLSIALLAGLWLPGRGYALANAKNPESLTMEMWRTSCLGWCPSYRITVHGNGLVEYVGNQYVRNRGPVQTRIGNDQIHTLLLAFGRANFFALEDRAFVGGNSHQPRVGVRITIDGKSKEVRSIGGEATPTSGPQAEFVEAAVAMDEIVGTGRWVRCDGERCRE